MRHISILSLFSFLIFSHCYTKTNEIESYTFPSNYSFQKMKKINLSKELEEISGLEWVSDEELWAIEDESSIIYVLNPKTGEIINQQKFAKNADIEEIMVYEGIAWALQSNGTIYQVDEPFNESINTTIHNFPFKGKNDFEAFIKSNQDPLLWIFCKSCQLDKSFKVSSIFVFNLRSMEFESEPKKVLKNDQLKSILKETEFKKIKMQPSAIAFHPTEQQYYLLSSSDNWLMILDQELIPKEFHKLDPNIFKQPEGITFSPDGTLFISNEARGGKPNLLIFPYQL